MSAEKYFESDEEENRESSEVVVSVKLRNMNKHDYSGKRFNEWYIVAVIDQRSNIYKVVCSCGKEFTRDVYNIVNYQVNQCRFCYKKKASFNLL